MSCVEKHLEKFRTGYRIIREELPFVATILESVEDTGFISPLDRIEVAI